MSVPSTEVTTEARAINLRRAWCLMPLILLLVVFGIGELVRPAAGFFSIPFEAKFATIDQCPGQAAATDPIYLRNPADSLDAFRGDMSGRMRWAAAAAVSIALGLMTLLTSTLIVARQLWASTRHPIRFTLVAIVALGAMSALVMSFGLPRGIPAAVCFVCLVVALAGHAANNRIGVLASVVLLFATTAWVITELPLPVWFTDAISTNKYRAFALTTPLFDHVQAVLYSSQVGWPWFDRAIGGLSVIVVVTLAIAVCALITDCRRESLEDVHLRERAESLRLLLYLGGGVLVGGVIYIKMLHDWPLALLCGKPAVALFTDLSNHWPVVVATYWSLMLVAIFVPAQISLSRAARRLATAQLQQSKATVSEKDIGEWLDARGMRASPAKQITQFVALLSPWLTSVPIAALFDYAKQAFGS